MTKSLAELAKEVKNQNQRDVEYIKDEVEQMTVALSFGDEPLLTDDILRQAGFTDEDIAALSQKETELRSSTLQAIENETSQSSNEIVIESVEDQPLEEKHDNQHEVKFKYGVKPNETDIANEIDFEEESLLHDIEPVTTEVDVSHAINVESDTLELEEQLSQENLTLAIKEQDKLDEAREIEAHSSETDEAEMSRAKLKGSDVKSSFSEMSMQTKVITLIVVALVVILLIVLVPAAIKLFNITFKEGIFNETFTTYYSIDPKLFI